MANIGADHWVQSSNIETMVVQAINESGNKKDFYVAEIAEKLVINAMEVCSEEGQHRPARISVS